MIFFSDLLPYPLCAVPSKLVTFRFEAGYGTAYNMGGSGQGRIHIVSFSVCLSVSVSGFLFLTVHETNKRMYVF